ncbi:right-handed parallel beta-helix repeat-containing protein [Burkholderia cepacia]|uniref:right-handed parallel beta-helix repeat-containing protein n=1 Tax=Burkholderia cepacia TaxID=292 RepID=UPI0019030E12|nr:right-handed parallel beta-helix repeat-containing protein [Burkholderia cepacia]MBJ9752719.1 right-handed parallel beta-helix repeat-containing protein [Burkholderia cepacia]
MTTTKLSLLKRRVEMQPDDILPVVGDGKNWAMRAEDMAKFVGPYVPVSEELITAAQTATEAANRASQSAEDAAASTAAIAQASSSDAGEISGAEVLPVSRGAGLLQTTLTKIAKWVTQTYQGVTQAGAGGVAQTIEGMLSKTLYVSDFDTLSHAVTAGLYKRLVIPVGTTVTLVVPTDCATIPAAMSAIAGWVIQGGVVILVADGTYVPTGTINLNHPYGTNIAVRGSSNTACVFQITGMPTFDLFVVSAGNTLGEISNIGLIATTKADAAHNATALLAVDNAKILYAPGIRTDNFYYGIAARNGAFINAPVHNVDHSGDVGVWAFCRSFINAQGGQSNNASDAANGWGWGYEAEYGSVVDCSGSSSRGCNVAGVGSLSNSQVRALNHNASGNIGSGFYASADGTIENHYSTAKDNGRYGIEELGGSRVLGNNVTMGNNTLGNIKPVATLDNGTLGARIVPNVAGPLRIDTADVGPVYFNTSGGLQAEVRDQAAATSRSYLQGGNAANANQPTFGSDGPAADISTRYQAKGRGAHYFRNGQGTQASIGNTDSAVNFPQLRGGAAGGAVVLEAVGSDAAIDVGVFPKGGGYINLGAAYNAGTVAQAGYVWMRTSDGVLRRFLIG